MFNRRWALPLAGLLAMLGVGLAVFSLWIGANTQGTIAPTLVGGPFTLVDQNGQTVTDKTYKGQPALVFFGYTHCPDVCPTTLADLSQVFSTLGQDKKIRALFVTVDPERDTPAALKSYLSSFDDRITGLTGSAEQVAAAEKAYRVYARKVPTQNGDYSMDHTSIVYLMDRDGRFVQSFDIQQAPDKAAKDLAAFL